MKQYSVLFLTAAFFLASCGGSKKEGDAALNDKKAQLEKLKGDKSSIDEKIKALEADLSKSDPASAQKTKLVSIQELKAAEFTHFIELQGKVDAENISYITPRGMGGQIRAIYVKQGDYVNKGQLLLKLDDAIQQQSLTAARQGLETIKSQLAYAKNIYQRQKNLWDQKIGTEVQLVTAKSNVSILEAQLEASEENVKISQEQLKTAQVYSDVTGVADLVTVHQGESFGIVGAGVIKIINTSQLKVVCNIPENYMGTFGKGTEVQVNLPDLNKTINSTVSFLGANIDPQNRGFVMEARLPADKAFKPNQIALLKVKDYSVASTIAIPLNTLQNDEKGKFVMVASQENGKLLARKRAVTIGVLNDNSLEIKAGLKEGEQLITEGYASLYEGQLLKLAAQ